MELKSTHTALLLIACYMAKRTGGVSPLAYNVPQLVVSAGLGERNYQLKNKLQ